MKVLKFSFSVCFIVLSLFVFGIVASAENGEDAFSYDVLNIVSDNAVLTGQTQQMRVKEYTGTGSGLLVWASNNPSVISCTPEGEIKGLKEGEATISVKAMFGDGYDSITVYCVQKLANPKTEKSNNFISLTFSEPKLSWPTDIHISFTSNPIADLLFLYFPLKTNTRFNVLGVYNSYFYVEYDRSGIHYEGFMQQNCFSDNVASGEVFKQLSRKDMNVFAGVKSDGYVLTTNYKGKVKWTVSDDTIIDFNEETGRVEGKKPGIATISATANGKTLTCTVHSIYVWPQDWTGAAREDTYVYRAEGTKYVKSSTTLSVGQKFIVKGDMGGDSSWAYGVSENNIWGYIPISHISTKGTVSQYNGLGWTYPIQDTKFKNISSVYGWRSGGRHLGFDINKGAHSTISGENVVAPFTGKVVFINKTYDYSTKKPDYGYCIIIATDSVDFVSGNKLYVVYMHLDEPPTLNLGDKVSPGKVLGKIGSTGNSTGPHLHLEINNKGTNFAGSSNSDSFDKTINPIFFYMNHGLKDSSDSSKDEYWYNDDK